MNPDEKECWRCDEPWSNPWSTFDTSAHRCEAIRGAPCYICRKRVHCHFVTALGEKFCWRHGGRLMTRAEKRERMNPGHEGRALERSERKRQKELAELRRLKEKYPDES